jgi:hypothetical protein
MTYTRARRLAALRSQAALDRAELFLERTLPSRRGLAHADPSPRPGSLERALQLGVSFLRHRQSADGVWKGFLLPPGAATTWMTAHIAFVVEAVPALTDACRRAAEHLESIGPGDGGWGFNRHVAVDSDSTAQALLVLHRFNRSVPEFLLDSLLSAQLPGGGFATYAPDGEKVSGWQSAHEDVTILAIEALRRHGRDEAAQRALRWLRTRERACAFASYWWLGPHYGLWARARTGLRPPKLADAVATALLGTRATPQVAQVLAAASALRLDLRSLETEAARQLLRTQRSDGSWPCSPCLRLTEPSEIETHAELQGRCYGDGWRVFSTAHAVAALQATLSATA